MRPRWSPAISQTLQQHGGSNRRMDRSETPATLHASVDADRPDREAPERSVNPVLSNLATG